jgi:hypothetical protein
MYNCVQYLYYFFPKLTHFSLSAIVRCIYTHEMHVG